MVPTGCWVHRSMWPQQIAGMRCALRCGGVLRADARLRQAKPARPPARHPGSQGESKGQRWCGWSLAPRSRRHRGPPPCAPRSGAPSRTTNRTGGWPGPCSRPGRTCRPLKWQEAFAIWRAGSVSDRRPWPVTLPARHRSARFLRVLLGGGVLGRLDLRLQFLHGLVQRFQRTPLGFGVAGLAHLLQGVLHSLHGVFGARKK